MGTPEMPPISATDRNLNAVGRAQADDLWATELLAAQEAASKKAASVEVTDVEVEEISTENLDNVARKAAAEAELQDLREKVAADKAKRAIVSASVKALTTMVGGPSAGENAVETAKMIQDLKTAQNELRDLDVAMLMSEQKLAAREADYRKDFPETLN